MKTVYITKILESEPYNNYLIDQELENLYKEGYELLHINSTYEPISAQFKVLLVGKLRPVAEAIYGD